MARLTSRCRLAYLGDSAAERTYKPRQNPMLKSPIRTTARRRLLTLAPLAAVCLMTALTLGCDEGENAELAILDIQPRSGSAQGNQVVTISGTGFRRDMGYSIYFGSQAAESMLVVNSEQIRVTTPQTEEGGSVDVLMRTDDGAAFRIAEAYTFADAPAAGSGADQGKLPF